MKNKPIIAIMYDFDRTLCTKDMQEFMFIPSLGISAADFWSEANELGSREKMDSILAYMYIMIKKSKEKKLKLCKETLNKQGQGVLFFKGVESWFERINEFGRELGVCVEHYVISSGLKEIIDGTSISDKFKEIYACEFLYDEADNAVWPKTAVNYTNKTQFVYRINKGVLDVSNDVDLNKSMPDDSKRVPFCNMIYIGDGLSDVPCMKMMKAYGGQAIAVYQEDSKEKVDELLLKERVDFIFPADYSENTGLDVTIKNIIRKMAINEKLFEEQQTQLKKIGK